MRTALSQLLIAVVQAVRIEVTCLVQVDTPRVGKGSSKTTATAEIHKSSRIITDMHGICIHIIVQLTKFFLQRSTFLPLH